MKILVTGANGYIGSKVTKRLLDMGHSVIAADVKRDYVDSRAEFIQCDIFRHRDDWFSFFGEPDVLLHMAWRDGFVHSSLRHMLDLSAHFDFIRSLAEGGLKHISVMGSMHEVGYFEGRIDENTPANPHSYYGIAKNCLRAAVQKLAEDSGAVFQWLRAFYIYSDDTNGSSIFCKINQAAAKGDKTFPFTSGKNMFDFISLDELTRQICVATVQSKVNGIINVCSGRPESLGEKAEWYIKSRGYDIKLEYGRFAERPFESPCMYGSNEKIKGLMDQRNLKILVTGAAGQLGYDCIRELKERGYENVLGIDRDELDITDRKAVLDFISSYAPDVVMHNAAWTAVDKAESCSEAVWAVNVLGTEYIAEACKKADAKMVYISTDYVFDGKGTREFETTDPKNGLSVYGRSKAEGEERVKAHTDKHFIVRTSWVFGLNGNNFVKTMLRLASAGKKELSVVCDQTGSVTYTHDLSKLLCDMIETDSYGVYHATNEGFVTWAEFASEIFSLSGLDVKVNGVSTDEYRKAVPSQAERPLNSRLSKKSLDEKGFSRLPLWKDALARYLNELKEKGQTAE